MSISRVLVPGGQRRWTVDGGVVMGKGELQGLLARGKMVRGKVGMMPTNGTWQTRT